MADLFGKIIIGINKGVNSVSGSSKVIVEKARINAEIEEIGKERIKLIQNMGALVYNLQITGQIKIEQCIPICNEIAMGEMKIEELKKELKDLENMKTQNVENKNIAADLGEKLCQCGFINKDTAKFCAGCGKPLSALTEEEIR